MRPLVKLTFARPLVLSCTSGFAQSTLGELLEAGARRLSAAEFRQEVVQRTMVGPSPTGGRMELVYTPNGQVAGTGTPPYFQSPLPGNVAQIDGEWSIDEQERICTVVSVLGYGRRSGNLPPRCQFWFKLGSDYYFSDSDSDRYAKVLRRSIKQ